MAAAPSAPSGGSSHPVKERIDALEKHQVEYDNLQKAFVAEQRALEKKYEPLYASVCAARRDIVTGAVDPVVGAGAGPKGIPGFWLTAMKNCRSIADFIEDHDEPVLEFLTDITTAYEGDLAGFRLDFHFAANPYFDNAVLSKVFHIPNFVEGAPAPEKAAAGAAAGAGAAAAAEEEEEEDEFADDEGFDVKAIDGCDIAWKSGKDVTVKITKKKSKGGKKGKGAVVVKEEPLPSFFRFFETPELVAPPGATEEEEEELHGQIDSEISVGMAFREKLIPEAVRWFTGEKEDDEEYDEDEDDEDGEDDEEDEEDEDEDEEEEEEPKKGGKKGGKGGINKAMGDMNLGAGGQGAPGAGGAPAPECKQQ